MKFDSSLIIVLIFFEILTHRIYTQYSLQLLPWLFGFNSYAQRKLSPIISRDNVGIEEQDKIIISVPTDSQNIIKFPLNDSNKPIVKEENSESSTRPINIIQESDKSERSIQL